MSDETFVLPPRAKVGYLDPSISGEGEGVLLSDGETVSWTPPPRELSMPDMSKVKTLQKYFNRRGFSVWPAWLYHPTEAKRIVKNADEAAELGVCYRAATERETSMYGVKAVWDYKDDCEWRSKPFDKDVKFDSASPGQGKTVVHGAPNPIIAQNALVEALIPQVAAAVATALKATGPSAPANIDAKLWDEFMAFQAFQKSAAAVNALGASSALADIPEPVPDAGDTDETPEDERAMWQAEAIRKGIKIDGRWSTERLMKEIEKTA